MTPFQTEAFWGGLIDAIATTTATSILVKTKKSRNGSKGSGYQFHADCYSVDMVMMFCVFLFFFLDLYVRPRRGHRGAPGDKEPEL